MVSRIVYDPEDTASDERAMSEIVRAIHVQTSRASDPKRPPDERKRAELLADRLAAIRQHLDSDLISIVDMTDAERHTYARLSAVEHAAALGLVFPLDDGEAASLAIALERGVVFASDDNDALTAMRSRHPDHPYQRIRRILIGAADRGLISREEANGLHDEMRSLGFWDTEMPFAAEGP